jgi:hypothetical protein
MTIMPFFATSDWIASLTCSNGLAEATVTCPPVNALSAPAARSGCVANAAVNTAKTPTIDRMFFMSSPYSRPLSQAAFEK